MPDVFLSYNREDHPVARRFAEAFERHGLEVWWDATLHSGEAYDEVTEKALREAKAVVVLWSKKSVASRWVRAEATLADRNKTFVPVMIEPCERPIMFELTQTAELFHWQGDAADAAWLAFLGDVRRFVQAKADSAQTVPPPNASATSQAHTLSRANRVAIAVLPFANMSGDREQEYFSDGISEDIITDLSKVSALSVISRNSAFTFKGKHVDLPQVARQLQVTHVLEGSVRKSGNRVRITAQLIHGASNDHIWAERYDRDLSDIFALQDEISQAIVAALKLKLFPEEKKAIEERGTTNLEAYDKYLRAQALADRGNPADSKRAADLFRAALALDPDFASARAGLVTLYVYRLVFAPRQREEIIQELDALVADALAYASAHWASHLANAFLWFARHDWLRCDAAYATMTACSPPSSALFFSALFLGSVGRNTEAVRNFEAARSSDPLSTAITGLFQQALFVANRADEAEAEYSRTLDLPGNREPHEHTALLRIWDCGDAARVKLQFRRYLDSMTSPFPVLNDVLGVLDQPAAARALIARALDDAAYQTSTHTMVLSWYAVLFGDIDLAIAATRRCYLEMHGVHVLALWFPFMRPMRKTPAFKQFVRDFGLYDYWRTSGQWGDFARPVGDDDFEIFR